VQPHLEGLETGRREVGWDGCSNARDLGGLPTEQGGVTRYGALYRSEHPGRLTAAGLQALRESGITRIVDLRSADEVAQNPSPLADDPAYRLVSLIDPTMEPQRDPAAERSMSDVYRGSVDRNGRTIAAALTVVADAPPGGVLVHCFAGKDRTGILVAIMLRLVGVPVDPIVEDYALSASCLGELFADQLREADEATHERLRAGQQSPPEAILAVLDHLDGAHGGVHRYVRRHGVTDGEVAALRERLLESPTGA